MIFVGRCHAQKIEFVAVDVLADVMVDIPAGVVLAGVRTQARLFIRAAVRIVAIVGARNEGRETFVEGGFIGNEIPQNPVVSAAVGKKSACGTVAQMIPQDAKSGPTRSKAYRGFCNPAYFTKTRPFFFRVTRFTCALLNT